VKEITTRNAVAEVHPFIGVKSEHYLFLAMTALFTSERNRGSGAGQPHLEASLKAVMTFQPNPSPLRVPQSSLFEATESAVPESQNKKTGGRRPPQELSSTGTCVIQRKVPGAGSPASSIRLENGVCGKSRPSWLGVSTSSAEEAT
jgi:hypothetical protein